MAGRSAAAAINSGVVGFHRDDHRAPAEALARGEIDETEWPVDPAQLGDFGVRNLTIVKQETCCSDSTFMGCTLPPTICF